MRNLITFWRGARAPAALVVALCLTVLLAANPKETPPAEAEARQHVCDDVVLSGAADLLDSLSFRELETRLICGDPDDPAWKEIPFHQKQSFLKAFLQERGYHRSTFIQHPHKRELVVVLGKPTRVTSLEVRGDIQGTLPRNRQVIGKVLTPPLLDGVEQWVLTQLDLLNQPCVTVESLASTTTGKIVVKVAGKSQVLSSATVGSLTIRPPRDLTAESIQSTFALSTDQPYRGVSRAVSERRAKHQRGLLNSYFLTKCEPKQVQLAHESSLGQRRSLSFGIGFDTEGLLKARARYQDKRLTRTGSNFLSELQASFVEQSLTNKLYLRPLFALSRGYSLTQFDVEHHIDSRSQWALATLKSGVGYHADFRGHGLRSEVLPAYSLERSFVGLGAALSRSLWLEVSQELRSHDHEFYESQPQQGFLLDWNARLARKGLVSTFSGSRLGVGAQFLANPFVTDPPFLVVGVRGRLATTLSSQASELPPSFLHKLGGSQDLRGFFRNELPESSTERALSSAFLGIELRHVVVPHNWAQPFLFADAGLLGQQSFGWTSPLYWNPGLGLRLETPFGNFRLMIAHGFKTDPSKRYDLATSEPDHFQFYFSFGEEF